MILICRGQNVFCSWCPTALRTFSYTIKKIPLSWNLRNRICCNAPPGVRTLDTLIKSQVLCQLSQKRIYCLFLTRQQSDYIRMFMQMQALFLKIRILFCDHYFFEQYLQLPYICDFVTAKVTVQPCISYIHKPASELSVAALQLLFISFQK